LVLTSEQYFFSNFYYFTTITNQVHVHTIYINHGACLHFCDLGVRGNKTIRSTPTCSTWWPTYKFEGL